MVKTWVKRAFVVSFLLIVAAVICFNFFMRSSRPVPLPELIFNTHSVKVEYVNDPDPLFMRSGSTTFHNLFSTLNIVECEPRPQENRIYRVTFDCNEVSPLTEEIVIEVYDTFFVANGVFYTTPEGVEFHQIIEELGVCYEYLARDVRGD